jgi:hypothetical protein
MNYSNIYTSLIKRARSRQLDAGIYFERHHIIPKCLGGTDEPENIVSLTPEEHYVAHQLLVKINKGHQGLAFAVLRMTTHTGNGRAGNKAYGWIRKQLAETQRGRKMSDEARANMSKAQKGLKKNLTPEGLERRKLALKSRIDSEETREKKRIASTGRKHSEETKRKMSEAQRGRSKSPEHIQKMSEAQKGKRLGHKDSEETRKKKSENRKGKIVSEETREKLRRAQLGKKRSEEDKAKIYTEERRKKMSDAAKLREQKKRETE